VNAYGSPHQHQVSPGIPIIIGLLFIFMAIGFYTNFLQMAERGYSTTMEYRGDYRPWGAFSRRPPSLTGFRVTMTAVTGIFGAILIAAGCYFIVQ
jgi:hypothetical protein